MITDIESSLPTFKRVSFHAGVNILLVDTTPTSSDRQTRNSAGKTSLIEIIHFLYGADCDPISIFRNEPLVGHTFTGTLRIAGEEFRVRRGGADSSKIFILNGGRDRADLQLKVDKVTSLHYVSNTKWRVFLGHALFGLPADVERTQFDEPNSPTFRSMFSYFARRENSGGLLSPERQAEKQQKSDWQVNLSYLLGLDWRIPHEFQKIRTREKSLEEVRKVAQGDGLLGDIVGTVAELRPQLAIAETTAEKLRVALANFEVLDSYQDIARRAARARSSLQSVTQEMVGVQETLQHLERSFNAETPPERADVKQVYEQAGVQLPGVALRRFDEVADFHSSVVRNRQQHLKEEIQTAKAALKDLEARAARLSSERSSLLKTLEGRGALEDFARIQKELAVQEGLAAHLRNRFKAAELLEGESTQLTLERVALKKRLQLDYQERKAAIDEAIVIIADAIRELYEGHAGRLIFDATDTGPEIRISIEGDRGGGIARIEIFFFDFALFKIVTKRLGGPGFLIHDSHLFDGVDPRQVAKALLLMRRTIGDRPQQYIVTMNSDVFHSLALPPDVRLDDALLATRLSDETETGGLFGCRF